MKLILILLSFSTLYGSNWNYDILAAKGWKIEIVCKNGYLTEVLNAPNGAVIEETYCYNKSSWDSSCKHPPVACKEK